MVLSYEVTKLILTVFNQCEQCAQWNGCADTGILLQKISAKSVST